MTKFSTEFELTLPPTDKFPEGKNVIRSLGTVAVVGANGAGKTRLGVWLENLTPEQSHRVSAQKSLQFPEGIRPMDSELAFQIFRVGDQHGGVADRRRHVRWSNSPETALLNDYDKLVEFLFSEHNEQMVRFAEEMRQTDKHKLPPKTKLDTVKRIWEAVLPNRELIITAAKVEARKRGVGEKYSAKELSDGERVIFYQIGEALSVPKKGVFIVDEPELHLHRAIQPRLWDAIEAERPDCFIIYLTHDLDFAASRKTATKIWLREYETNKWDWDIVPETNEFSEEMFLEILGSRKPILFIEGNKASLDYFVYGKTYPAWTAIPIESCEQVIHATTSFDKLRDLHANTCRGIVDFDSRTAEDVGRLEKAGVAVLQFAELENVFLTEPVLRLVAKRLALENGVIDAAKERVFTLLHEHRERVVSRLTARELEFSFQQFDARALGASALTAGFRKVFDVINPEKVFAHWDEIIGEVIDKRDYNGALKYYNNKGLASELGAIFKMPIVPFILRLLQTREADDLLSAVQSALPKISA
jgi:energy-coupling factor transporter ATP-binding protein EcfA2